MSGPTGVVLTTRLPSGAPLTLALPAVWYSYYHDDGRVWLFDVVKARAIAQANTRARGRPQMVDPKALAPSGEAWAARCRDLSVERSLDLTFEELSQPVLIVLIEGAHLLIDGSHRVYWALLHQVDRLFAEFLEDPTQVEAVTIAQLDGEAAVWAREKDL